MFYFIENEDVKATFSAKGAELCSLILKKDGTEYLWQANPDIWPRHAPLLFPFIGRLKDKEYTFEGKTFHAASHGFGRDSVFDVLQKETDCITFVLHPNDLSAEMYPFAFELQICYQLQGHTLKKTHTFFNKEDRTLYYEIGGHDGYNLCLEEGEKMEDYYLDFGSLDALYPLCLDENIMILKGTYKIPLVDGKLPLSMELFRVDALMLHDIPVHTIQLKSRKSDRMIQIDFEDFKTIGIWTKYKDFDTNYLCFEPWSSLPDCAYLGKELEEKIDVRKVPAGETDTLSFSITIR